jgi:hypothetical protein
MPLEHKDFYIGREFWTATGRWRCTDVGTRTICAIKLEGDPENWIGPPYAAAEFVFDEYDLCGIYAIEEEWREEMAAWPEGLNEAQP